MTQLKEKLIKTSLSMELIEYAQVVELVDTRDLKSLEGNFVPVQVRSGHQEHEH